MKKIITFLTLLLYVPLAFSQWSTDPGVNNLVAGIPTDEVVPQVATAGNGNTYIAWYSLEGGNYNVRMQLYDVQGNELWASGGLLVSSHPSETWVTDFKLSTDKENCAIVGFHDIRNGNSNIHVYRIGPTGQFFWGVNGLSLSNNTAFEPYPFIAVTDNNDVVFAWESQDTAGKSIIRMQRVAPDSTRLWGPDGIIFQSATSNENYIWPELVPGNNNSAILVFHKRTGSWMNAKDLYAQKFDLNGAPVWANDVPVYVGPGIPIIPQTCVEPDSLGGAVVCWHDTRAGNGMFNVYVQHIQANGTLVMPAGGVAVSTGGSFIQMNPSMTYLPATQDIYAFFDVEDPGQSSWGLSGQKINNLGQLVWTNNMLTLLPVGNILIDAIFTRRSVNQVLVTYQYYDFTNNQNSRILATLLNDQGQPVWNPSVTTICNVDSTKGHQVTGYYSHHQWVLAWEDSRNGNPDLYAQNILINGALGPYPMGIDHLAVCGSHTATIMITPNPVTDNSLIYFKGTKGEKATINCYNLVGEKVGVLFSGNLTGEEQNLRWNLGDQNTSRLPSGLYFLEMKSTHSSETIKVVVKE